VRSNPFKQTLNTRRFLILIGLVLLAVLLVVSPVWGSVETRSGQEVRIGPDEVVGDDLYVTANEVVVDGTIEGDLVAFGRSITVNGTVEGDLIAAGQTVEVGGTVEDDARIAGQALLLGGGGSVGDDLLAAGYSLENVPDSAVGGTLLYAGYQALLAGSVGEDFRAAANGVQLDGEVAGDVNVEVDGESGATPVFAPVAGVELPMVEAGLTLTSLARVGGDLTYQSSAEAQIDPGTQVEGEVVREERPAEEVEEEAARNPVIDWVLDTLRSLVALLLVGLLLVWLVPGWIRRLAHTVLDRPLAILGWGLLGLIAFVALGVAILLVTILLAVIFGLLTLGSLVALIIVVGLLGEVAVVFAFWISTNYLAQIVVSYLAGVLLVEGVRPGRGSERVLPLVVGLVVYAILRAIPVLGLVIGLLVVLVGLGALSNWIWTKLRRRPAQPQPAA
jgi:cytoskeletal protein CcmA (bactofilin family)